MEVNLSDPYFLAALNHSGMCLTNVTFNGSNFLNWSKQIKIALDAKFKIGYLNGTITAPTNESSDEYKKWIRADYMVIYGY